jgi:hypothetical protein
MTGSSSWREPLFCAYAGAGEYRSRVLCSSNVSGGKFATRRSWEPLKSMYAVAGNRGSNVACREPSRLREYDIYPSPGRGRSSNLRMWRRGLSSSPAMKGPVLIKGLWEDGFGTWIGFRIIVAWGSIIRGSSSSTTTLEREDLEERQTSGRMVKPALVAGGFLFVCTDLRLGGRAGVSSSEEVSSSDEDSS